MIFNFKIDSLEKKLIWDSFVDTIVLMKEG